MYPHWNSQVLSVTLQVKIIVQYASTNTFVCKSTVLKRCSITVNPDLDCVTLLLPGYAWHVDKDRVLRVLESVRRGVNTPQQHAGAPSVTGPEHKARVNNIT